MKIKEMNLKETPREKAKMFGFNSLSNRDILAIILRCGSQKQSVLELSDILLNNYDNLISLSKTTYEDLIKYDGISTSKALSLLAVFELAKRLSKEKINNQPFNVNSPLSFVNYLNQRIGLNDHEEFLVAYLNQTNQIIKDEVLFKGTLNESIVHPRDIYKAAITYNSASIIIAHNHPSGDCLPSKQDIDLTNRLIEISKLVGIRLIDHIIVGNNTHFSFKEHELI